MGLILHREDKNLFRSEVNIARFKEKQMEYHIASCIFMAADVFPCTFLDQDERCEINLTTSSPLFGKQLRPLGSLQDFSYS